MIVMTLNCRGLASKPKKLVICRLVSEQSVDVLFLQETMGDQVLFAGEMEGVCKKLRVSFGALDAIQN